MAWNINVSSGEDLLYFGGPVSYFEFASAINYTDANEGTNDILFKINGYDWIVNNINKDANSGTATKPILIQMDDFENLLFNTPGRLHYVSEVTGSEETGQTTNGLLQMLKDKYYEVVVDVDNSTTYFFEILLLEVSGGFHLMLITTGSQIKSSGITGPVLSTNNVVSIHCLEVKPSYIDEGKVFTYWTGKKAKSGQKRMSFSVECYPFTTQGDYTGTNGFEKYYNISDILLSNEVIILSADSDFERINNYFSFPIRTICTDFGELSSNKDQNNVKLTFKLEEKERR